jgi:hypothetical protein
LTKIRQQKLTKIDEKISRWMEMATKMAIKAVRTVHIKENGRTEIDIKRFAKVEKIPGGQIEDSEVNLTFENGTCLG